jgi:hypothetical protein
MKNAVFWYVAATCSRWFPARGFFYPENGGDTFLRNVGSHKIYKAPRPRRRHSSLRKPVWKTRFDRTRRQDISRQCNVQETGEWITRRRDEWNGHVSRMAPERIVRTAIDNTPVGRRTSTPHRRWSDSHSGNNRLVA